VLDQPLLAEQPQRLAQRGPADAEAAGQVLLHQPLARGQRSAEDLRAQPTHRELGQAVRTERLAVEHRERLAARW